VQKPDSELLEVRPGAIGWIGVTALKVAFPPNWDNFEHRCGRQLRGKTGSTRTQAWASAQRRLRTLAHRQSIRSNRTYRPLPGTVAGGEARGEPGVRCNSF